MVKMLLLFRHPAIKGDIPDDFLAVAVGEVFPIRMARDHESCPNTHRGLVVEVQGLATTPLRKAVAEMDGTSYFLNDQTVDQWLNAHGLAKR